MFQVKIRLAFILCAVILSITLLSYQSLALTDIEAKEFSQQSYKLALSAQEKHDIELASIYFMNALSFSPGNIEIISDYVLMILTRAREDTTLIDDTFDALDSFLNAQIMTVKPDDLPKILELRAKLSEEHNGLLFPRLELARILLLKRSSQNCTRRVH